MILSHKAEGHWMSYTSFGSLFNAALKKSYAYIQDQMVNWLPTRYLAAWMNVNQRDCSSYLTLASTNETKVAEICQAMPFDNLDQLYFFTLAPMDASVKATLLNQTKLTEDEYAKLYNSTDPESLGSRINSIYTLISLTHSCESPNLCTGTELTLKQFSSGSVTLTQPAELASNQFLGKVDKCLTKAWNSNLFSCPEYVNYAPDGFTMNSTTAGNLFDTSNGLNVDDASVATILTNAFMNKSQEEELNSTYQIDGFFTFFEGMRSMVQQYLLGGS